MSDQKIITNADLRAEMMDELSALRAENAQLRAALKQILKATSNDYVGLWREQMTRIAKAALKDEKS